MQPVSWATTVTRSFSSARRAWAESAVPLNHMFLVTSRRLLVRMPSADVDEVLRVQRRGHEEDVAQRDPAHDEQRRRVERGQRDALAGAGRVVRLVAEGVHGLDGLGLPVGDDVALVLVEAEVRADVDVEVVLVALVAEEGVGLRERLLG